MRRLLTTALLGALLLAAGGTAQVAKPPAKFVPKFAVVAETRLLMDGLAQSNFRSIGKQLKAKPADNDTWTFVRGQAILIAETGNLLLLRPPRNSGRDTWMKLSMAMRDQAGSLARSAAARDYASSKAELSKLATACNRCHTTFKVPVRVAPEADATERDAE